MNGLTKSCRILLRLICNSRKPLCEAASALCQRNSLYRNIPKRILTSVSDGNVIIISHIARDAGNVFVNLRLFHVSCPFCAHKFECNLIRDNYDDNNSRAKAESFVANTSLSLSLNHTLNGKRITHAWTFPLPSAISNRTRSRVSENRM